MTIIRYRAKASGQVLVLESALDPWTAMDKLRAKFHPEIEPSMKEPSFLEAKPDYVKSNVENLG